MSQFKNIIKEIGFWIWIQKVTFTALFFSKLTSRKTYSSWENLKSEAFNLLIPFIAIFVVWSFTGFTTNSDNFVSSLQIVLLLYGFIVLLRFFFHKELGILKNGEFYFLVGLTISTVAGYVFSISIVIEEYNYPFIIALFTAIPPSILFAYAGYLIGGSLILGD